VEMVPPLIALAERIGADLLVYHLGTRSTGMAGRSWTAAWGGIRSILQSW
jgi:hypothetical protein